MTTHILGMAKSSLDLRGAKSSKLELDFLKLLVAINRIRAKGEFAQGYLLVFTDEIKRAVNGWTVKYDTGDSIQVLMAAITDAQLADLRKEKIRNADALLKMGDVAGAEALLSVAAEGKAMGEAQLHHQIKNKFQDIVCKSSSPTSEMPLTTAWDFYGTISG